MDPKSSKTGDTISPRLLFTAILESIGECEEIWIQRVVRQGTPSHTRLLFTAILESIGECEEIRIQRGLRQGTPSHQGCCSRQYWRALESVRRSGSKEEYDRGHHLTKAAVHCNTGEHWRV